MMILQKDSLQHTCSIQVFIKTVQFIIINGTRLLYKNEHVVHNYTERILQDKNFIIKISTGLNPKDILVITFHIVLFETGGGKKYLL
jgi:hypothetical protein